MTRLKPLTFLLTLILLNAVTIVPAMANDFVDHSLSHVQLTRLMSSVDAPKLQAQLEGQMVLWQGWIDSQIPVAENSMDILLRTGDQVEVPVHFRKGIRNLTVDRTGYRVAIKGRLRFNKAKDGGGLNFLEGRSIILLEPPGPAGFSAFQKQFDLTSSGLVSFIGWRFWLHRPDYSIERLQTLGQAVVDAADKEDVDPLLLAGLLQIESAYNAQAVSHSGAIGLGQLMAFTASGLGVNPWDPVQNIQGSAHYLGGLLHRFSVWSDPIVYSLAAYNAGPGSVERYHSVPPVAETTNYVAFVRLVWKELKSEAQRYGVQ